MTLIDVEALLAPIADDTVCGIALEYDPDYLALERSIEGSPERQYGDTVIPAKAPDWSGIARQATELLAKSKDFNLAVILTRALTHTRGIEGTLAGMQLVLELGRRHWDEAFPSLHFDGEADLLPRSNAIAGLAAQEGLLHSVATSSVRFSRKKLPAQIRYWRSFNSCKATPRHCMRSAATTWAMKPRPICNRWSS